MTDSTLADRTYLAALTQWESNGLRGPRPERASFDHLNAVPDEIPAADPGGTALAGSDADPAPLDAATADAVKAVLEQMQAGNRTRGGLTPHDSGPTA